MLALQNIRKVYKDPQEIIIFENVNLTIEEEEIVSIIGPSGSGKTTLLNLIGLIDSVDEGEITIFGKNVKNLTNSEILKLRNESIGFIFQNPHLIEELNVIENILIRPLIKYKFLNSKIKSKAFELLKYMEIEDKSHHFPSELSGGEKQRVAIARALINNPKIIIADEPTANLDPSLKFSIMELLRKIKYDFKITIVFSTHDYEILKYATKIFKIENRNLKLI